MSTMHSFAKTGHCNLQHSTNSYVASYSNPSASISIEKSAATEPKVVLGLLTWSSFPSLFFEEPPLLPFEGMSIVYLYGRRILFSVRMQWWGRCCCINTVD